MMSNNLKRITIAGLAISLVIPVSAFATNGMFLIGHGAKSRAMGGVAIAHGVDSLSAAANPATIAGMDNRFDIGMDIFMPTVESQLGSVSAQSEANINGIGLDETFFMPAMGITYKFSDDITLGFSMVSAGGGGTKFTTNFFEAAAAGSPNAANINEKLGVDLVIAEMNPTVAYKLDDKNSVGLTFVIAIARFNAYGLGLFDPFTQTSGSLEGFSNQGVDWTYGGGLRLGWTGQYGDLSLGAVYTTKVFMDEFNHYTELFAENGDMDVPANIGIGMSYKVLPELRMAMDITHTFYEDVKSIGNTGPNLAGDPAGPLGSNDRQLGLPDGLGFGWENQTVVKLGAEYNYSSDIILRAGWNYGKSPINEEREIIFNTLAPATVQHHLTMGGTYMLSADMEINLSYVHAFEYEQSGPTYVSDDGSNYGRISMSQNAYGGSFSMKF